MQGHTLLLLVPGLILSSLQLNGKNGCLLVDPPFIPILASSIDQHTTFKFAAHHHSTPYHAADTEEDDINNIEPLGIGDQVSDGPARLL